MPKKKVSGTKETFLQKSQISQEILFIWKDLLEVQILPEKESTGLQPYLISSQHQLVQLSEVIEVFWVDGLDISSGCAF